MIWYVKSERKSIVVAVSESKLKNKRNVHLALLSEECLLLEIDVVKKIHLQQKLEKK